MICWEVYERDTQRCVLFLSEKDALNQTIFSETDIISESEIDLTQPEIDELNTAGYLWCD